MMKVADSREAYLFPDIDIAPATMTKLTDPFTPFFVWLAIVIDELGPGHWEKYEHRIWI